MISVCGVLRRDVRETSLVRPALGRQGMDERMKTVFTTGEAAKICKVSQQTIIRCFDNGQLKGFRVPGSRFRRIPRSALQLVVGLLLTALYRPVWTSAIFGPADFALGIVAFLLLALWAVPPWLVVILGALGAGALAML